MPAPEKRNIAIETHWESAVTWLIIGVISLIVGCLLFFYGSNIRVGFVKATSWDLSSFGWPFLALAPLALLYSGYRMFVSRNEPSFLSTCPYCNYDMEFTSVPEDDFVCDSCHRRVPVMDGRILEVHGVTCGYCGHANYMSEKTLVLICEECDREIPLLNPDTGEMRHLPRGFARVDDDGIYELTLVAEGREKEALLTSLQHILALNRNQVKDLIENLPVVLLTGIPRRKAEMLKAQVEASGGTAEFKVVGRQPAAQQQTSAS
ncbi:MAG: ribosomal protein L7/L12 [Fimbriimonadales bacterium]